MRAKYLKDENHNIDFSFEVDGVNVFFISEYFKDSVDLCFSTGHKTPSSYGSRVGGLTISSLRLIATQLQSWVDYWFDCRNVRGVTFSPVNDTLHRMVKFAVKHITGYRITIYSHIITIEKEQPTTWVAYIGTFITAARYNPHLIDPIDAIGRDPEPGEQMGFGKTRKEAIRDGIMLKKYNR